jgi:signal transduction histidine kinase
MISEAFVDFVLKALYMSYIVEMHQKVFDEGVRAKRRLEELRQMMWDNSSDVMAISVESLFGIVTTMVSPAFVKMLRQGKATTESLETEMQSSTSGDKGMTFEMSKADLQSFLSKSDSSSMPSVQPTLYDFRIDELSSKSGKKKVQFQQDAIGPNEMLALAELMARSWQCQERDSLLSHDLVYRKDTEKLGTIKCEARVTKLEESALFVVVRDISERFHRFEAEKLAVSEMTARRKDSEANRFTRHEVKNGLLAAIGLCESMNDTIAANLTPEVLTTIEAYLGVEHTAEMNKLFSVQNRITTLVKEMDTALQEVLDTILAEAMARDVIHENYSPQLEKMNLAQLLQSLTRHTEGKGKSDRFPVATSPDPFPTLMCDRQLLKCIHRNAVSNASKYGQRGGVVSTTLVYDEAKETMHLQVVNEPGEKHEQLLQLDDEGTSNVFAQGVRLHPALEGGEKRTAVARQSSGDGAWIMQKCAKTLGGDCRIEFQDEKTVFSMSCPATSVSRANLEEFVSDKTPVFKFPKRTWGIAIDDSKIQRKLLKQMLVLAGIDEKRIVILGETADEIRTFDDLVIGKVDNHPNDYFLLVVDENLDIDIDDLHVNQTTISGSMLIQNIRHRVLAEQERQMLAVVRSANDSTHDIAIYNSRAHGFMPKAPLKKESVLEVLAPLWESRFSVIENLRLDSDTMSRSSDIDSFGGLSDAADDLMQDESEGFEDLIQGHVRALDELMRNEDSVDSRWPEIREKLHLLKGDLSSLNFPISESSPIIEQINGMRVKNAPVDWASKWGEMQQLVLRLSGTSRKGLVD